MRTLTLAVAGLLVAAALLIVSIQGSAIARQLGDLTHQVSQLDAPLHKDYCDGYREAWLASGEPFLDWSEVEGCSS